MEKLPFWDLFKDDLERIAQSVGRRSGVDIRQLLIQCLAPAISRGMIHSVAQEGGRRRYLPGELDHVGDWLAAAVRADLPWLKNVDENGVPRKFTKLHSVESVFAEAERGMQRLLRETSMDAVSQDEEEVVAKLLGEYRLVSLKSPAALDRESKVMQHCVGLGGYDEGLANGSTSILSLRDARGRPHVTIELSVENNRIHQIRGKQNCFPLARYFDLLVPWINEQGLQVVPSELVNGYFSQQDGPIRHVSQLTENERIPGNLNLLFNDDAHVDLVLPAGLHVDGSLTVSATFAVGKKVIFGPETSIGGTLACSSLRIHGLGDVSASDMRIVAGEVESVSADCRISSNASFSGTNLNDLLNKAVFEANVELDHIEQVCIPSEVAIRGDLRITGASCVTVQQGAVIGGNFTVVNGVEDCRLNVKRDVRVGGNLSSGGTIATFESGLEVQGEFALSHVETNQLPDGMDVNSLRLNNVRGLVSIPDSAVIRGDVSILNSSIKSLGSRRCWPGDLRIPRVSIESLPADLEVEGELEVSYTPLREFPRGMRIGSLVAKGCRTGVIPEDAIILGGIDLTDNHQVSLPDGMIVDGDLNLSGAYMKRTPSNISVTGMLRLDRFPVDRIRRFAAANSYVISNSFVIDISDMDDVEGDMWIDSNHVSSLPQSTRIGGKLVIHGDNPSARLPDNIKVGGYVRCDQVIRDNLVPPSASIGGGIKADR